MFMSNHEGDVRYGSSGKLLDGYEAKLIDHEGKPTPDGDVGNLWIRGASAAIGYVSKARLSASAIVELLDRKGRTDRT